MAPDDLAQPAQRRDLTVALAESLTSGLLATRVGEQEGASDWFAGSVVAYQTHVKESVLGVTPGIDPCSAECAGQLAAGARSLLGAHLAVATTGVGGPDPQDGHAPGTVYIGWATADTVGHEHHVFTGEPPAVLEQTVDAAMRILRSLADRDVPADEQS